MDKSTNILAGICKYKYEYKYSSHTGLIFDKQYKLTLNLLGAQIGEMLRMSNNQ